jgi:hypothetical protein
VRAELDDAIDAVTTATAHWQSLGQAWHALERAADLSRNPATLLDIPKFPIDVSGDADVLPVPSTLAGGDPTIKNVA